MKSAIVATIVCTVVAAVIGALLGGFILTFIFTWLVQNIGAKIIILHTLLLLLSGGIGGVCTGFGTIPFGLKAIRKGADGEMIGGVSIILGGISGIISAILGYFDTLMFAHHGLFSFLGTSTLGTIIVGLVGCFGGTAACWKILTCCAIGRSS